ncbi:hypothetical protein C8J57DRAFT_1296003 [Mycena rebaudengoi]|nr:hypothetical protein C8J57DRAFT_1296003 [Mycena rebaudengoi]
MRKQCMLWRQKQERPCVFGYYAADLTIQLISTYSSSLLTASVILEMIEPLSTITAIAAAINVAEKTYKALQRNSPKGRVEAGYAHLKFAIGLITDAQDNIPEAELRTQSEVLDESLARYKELQGRNLWNPAMILDSRRFHSECSGQLELARTVSGRATLYHIHSISEERQDLKGNIEKKLEKLRQVLAEKSAQLRPGINDTKKEADRDDDGTQTRISRNTSDEQFVQVPLAHITSESNTREKLSPGEASTTPIVDDSQSLRGIVGVSNGGEQESVVGDDDSNIDEGCYSLPGIS